MKIPFFKTIKERAWTLGATQNQQFLIEQLRGRVEQTDSKYGTQSKKGEKHPFDFGVTEHYYRKFGFVTGAVDKIVDFVWGPGIYTKSKNARAKKIIDDWLQDVDFDYHGRKWFKEGLVKGNGFLELGGKQDEPVKGIKVLDAKNMFVEREKTGDVKKFYQVVGKKGIVTKDDTISFEPYQVAHLPINQIGSGAYGDGIVYPALPVIELFLKNLADLHKLMGRKANSPLIATVGDKEKDILPSQEQLDAFANKMTYMNEQTEWAVPADVTLTSIDFGNFGDKFNTVLDTDIDLLFFTFQIPEVLMGRGSIPEGLATVQLEAFEQGRVAAFQSEIEKVIEQKIFRRVLQAQGIDDHVEIVWGQPGKSEVNTQVQLITTLLSNPMIGDNLRMELEKKLAGYFDIEEKAVEDDDAERENEEEEPQPIVPGQNEALVVGDLLQP